MYLLQEEPVSEYKSQNTRIFTSVHFNMYRCALYPLIRYPLFQLSTTPQILDLLLKR